MYNTPTFTTDILKTDEWKNFPFLFLYSEWVCVVERREQNNMYFSVNFDITVRAKRFLKQVWSRGLQRVQVRVVVDNGQNSNPYKTRSFSSFPKSQVSSNKRVKRLCFIGCTGITHVLLTVTLAHTKNFPLFLRIWHSRTIYASTM